MLTDANSKPMSEVPAPPDQTSGADSADADVLAFPASAAQEAFFYLEKLFPSHPAFNVPVRFKLDGALDLSLLRNAFNSLAARHEGLRTRFVEDDGKLLQVIAPETTFPIPLTDISHLSGDELDLEIDRLGSIEARTHFDLGKDPLFRASILRLDSNRHILQITIHHSVADGWSIGIMTDELAEYYNAELQAREPKLEPLSIQYADFTLWQREFLESPELQPHLNYWKDRLRNYVELELPSDRPRPALKSWDGDIVSRILPSSMIERVARISREEGATMFHVFLAAFKAVASRYTGLEDIAIGTPVAGRTREELEPIIGTFINSVILRTDLSGDPSFRQLVGRVRDTSTEAIAHQDLPFEQLVKALQPRRESGRNPLFQINFTHQRDFVRPVSFGGAKLTAFPSRSPGAIFDLHFFMVERADGWRASCDFARDLFDRETALRLLEHFETFLDAATTEPDQPLSKSPIIPPSEMLQLEDWSGGRHSYPSEIPLGDLFLKVARDHAERTALAHDTTNISYRQLALAAIGLSSRLTQAGVRPGDRVALCAPSVPEMIAAQIAILLSGAACVPLDPDYPVDRLRFMLEDSGAKVLLATPVLSNRLSVGETTVIQLDGILGSGTGLIPEDLPSKASPLDASHIFYTSGSTGQPKGVRVCHRGVSRLAHGDFIEFGPEDSFLQSAPISFDAAILEIWMPLLHGGRVVLTGDKGTSLSSIAHAVKHQGVTCLWLTAGLFQSMVDEHLDDLKGLRHLLAGGDVLSPPHVRKAFESLPATRIVNGYGPTENTTFTCCHTITRADLDRPSIPIGRPIGNTTVAILDEKFRPVPIGVPGELFTGGDGLALGYLNRPDLTDERFVPHPKMGRAYRTGDLCRWLPDGTIEFIGRRDGQVKIRGFRIELGEIEAVISSHPAVRQVKVEVRGKGAEDKVLLAWVVAPNGQLTSESLASFLADRLPAYMRPHAIGLLDELPLSSNGKVDTRSLESPLLKSSGKGSTAIEAPEGETETRLAHLWKQLLGREEIGRDDDFFSIGGHSLMALRLFSRINREFSRNLPLSSIITHSTIRSLARLLEPEVIEGGAKEPLSVPVPKKGHFVTLSKGESEPPLICIHGGDGGVIFYRGLAGLLPKSIPIHAIESLELSSSDAIKPTSVSETAYSYVAQLLSEFPKGPFRLVGYSFGGVVAHEMACLLEQAGHKVEFLGLFDTHNPTARNRAYSMPERLGYFWKQNLDVPLASRLVRLGKRILEGIATNRRVHQEIRKATTHGPAEPHSDLRRVQVREENWRAMQAHKPRTFKGRLTLFKAMTASDKVEWDDDFGWSAVAGHQLDIVPVPGRHLTLFESPNLETLAKAVENSIRKNHGDPS